MSALAPVCPFCPGHPLSSQDPRPTPFFGHPASQPSNDPASFAFAISVLHGRVAVLAFHLAHNFTFASVVVFLLPFPIACNCHFRFLKFAIRYTQKDTPTHIHRQAHIHTRAKREALKPKLKQKQKQKAAPRMHRHFHFHAWAHRSESIIHHHRLSGGSYLAPKQPVAHPPAANRLCPSVPSHFYCYDFCRL